MIGGTMTGKAGRWCALASLFLPLLAAGAALAAEPTQSGMTTGETQIPPRQTVVSETGDEIRASDAIGRELRTEDGQQLGTVADLLVGRERGRVDIAVIDRPGKDVAVAWSSLRYAAKPSPHFVSELTADEIANGPGGDEARRQAEYFDVKRDLLGRDVAEARGNAGGGNKTVGRITDVVTAFGDGRVVALLIDLEASYAGVKTPYVVTWEEARLGGGREGPLTIALSADEIRRKPQYATKAPEPNAPAETSGPSTKTQPGTPLGTGTESFVPAPDTRRR